VGLPQVDYFHEAVMGYALTCHILSAHPSISRHAMPVFLTLLAMLQRQGVLTSNIWQEILRANSQLPVNNWGQFNRISRHPAASQAMFGISFSPPRTLTELWEVRTQWTSDEAMGFLMTLQPSLHSINRLMAFADVHMRSRVAGSLIGSVAIPNLLGDHMFLAPYVNAAPIQGEFAEPRPNTLASEPLAASDTAAPVQMDVDDEQTQDDMTPHPSMSSDARS